MSTENLIKGNSEEEVWQQIDQQLQGDSDLLNYTAIIQQGDQQVILNIDIDLGGGFESGYETTSFTAPLHASTDFRFAIHEEHFTDEIGKFFGMQDVVIGYEEFDKRFIIKTNDEVKVKAVFADPSIRAQLETLNDFTFGITTHHTSSDVNAHFVELVIESGITDPQKLRAIYSAFFSILNEVNKAI